MTKKVLILGGGIGGLTAAHELSKLDKFEITVIERNNHLGGQAAELSSDDNKIYSALCWHAISSRYKYLLDILNEIYDINGIKVISHLQPIRKFIYGLKMHQYIEYDNSFITNGLLSFDLAFEKLYNKKMPKKDKKFLTKMHLYANLISDKRLNSFDSILWKTYIKDLSPDVKRWILDSTSIYLGMDYSKLSTYFMFRLLRNNEKHTRINQTSMFHAFDGPMDKMWFNPWKKQLETKGVKFLLNHEVKKIHHTKSLTTISTIEVINKDTESIQLHYADIFINAMDTQNLANLYPIENTKFQQLHDKSAYVQTQVLYYLPYRLQPIGTGGTILILPDTPWFLMIRIEGDLWQLESFDYLSCGIGMWDTCGHNGKKAINCTREEIAQECWDQIHSSQHNLKLSLELPKYNIWDSFQYDADLDRIITYEPKFSNNINTQKLRPNFLDKNITNLYHATSYANTNTNIYNMESAAEAGVETANIIITKAHILRKESTDSSKLSNALVFNKYGERPLSTIIKLCRAIDRYIFKISHIYETASNMS